MDIIKDIASIIGLILSCITLLTLCSKAGRSLITSLFKKHNKEQDEAFQEVKEELKNIKEALEAHIKDSDEFKKESREVDLITLEFTRQQCRNIIKDMFYKYYLTKELPMYERKTLDYIEEIYINTLKGNSYASRLVEEMKTWQVDYMTVRLEEE